MIVLILDLDTDKLYKHNPDKATLKALLNNDMLGLSDFKKLVESKKIVEVPFGQSSLGDLVNASMIFKIKLSEIFVELPMNEGSIQLEDWQKK